MKLKALEKRAAAEPNYEALQWQLDRHWRVTGPKLLDALEKAMEGCCDDLNPVIAEAKEVQT